MVTGLNANSIEFSVSPPYFNFPAADGKEGGGIYTSMIEEEIKRVLSSLVLGGNCMSPQNF